MYILLSYWVMYFFFVDSIIANFYLIILRIHIFFYLRKIINKKTYCFSKTIYLYFKFFMTNKLSKFSI
ncbi:MAG: hypothetical protein CMF74_17625 [Maricaulis sp.]|nr:hypothetical protein [Maricaulis sp.]